MAILDPDGLFGGDRLAALSDTARLYWPWFYSAANGCARMELNLRALRLRIFSAWQNPPSEDHMAAMLAEYVHAHLMFIYEAGGQQWAQFDTPEKLLPRHKTKRDLQSPPPPPALRDNFQKSYISWKNSKSLSFHGGTKLFADSRENARGIGVGVGEGVGEGEGGGVARPPEPAVSYPASQACLPEPVETASEPPQAPVEPKPAHPRRSSPFAFHGPSAADQRRESCAAPDDDIEALIREIICAHPRSLLKSLRPMEALAIDQGYVLDAILSEAAIAACSPREAGDMLLGRMNAFADTSRLPRHEWRFLKPPGEFCLHKEYRREPEEFTHSKPQGDAANGDLTDEAIRQAGKRRAGDGARSE